MDKTELDLNLSFNPTPHQYKAVTQFFLRYFLAAGPALLAHAMQKVSIIVGLTALRLAFFMGYE